jgi:hypothetical protein
MPSFKGNASVMDDIKKLTRDTSGLKGNAKKVVEEAQDRAITRSGIRAAGAAATATAAKVMSGKDATAKDKSDSYEDSMGDANVDSSNPTGVSGKGMAKGGSASSRADGIATRGKTRGKIC